MTFKNIHHVLFLTNSNHPHADESDSMRERFNLINVNLKFLSQVHQQHLEHNRKFLVEELGIYNREEADHRIFFVSAKEALYARLQEQGGLPPHSNYSVQCIM